MAPLTRHTFNTFAPPWVAYSPHAGVAEAPWVYTTVGEMCAPAFTSGGVNGPLMGPSPARPSMKSCGCEALHLVRVRVRVRVRVGVRVRVRVGV